MVTAWGQAAGSPCLVATSALGAGLDYPSVRRVVHVDAPSGLVDYGQETGRAGRDGLHASCVTLLPPKWSVDWGRRYRTDFLQEDCAQMDAWLRWGGCLRQKLTAYLDGSLEGGRYGVTCHQADGIERAACSRCRSGPGPSQAPPEPQDGQPPRGKAASLTLDSLSLTSSSGEEESAGQGNPQTGPGGISSTACSRPRRDSSSAGSSGSSERDVTDIEVWSVADCMRRQRTMQDAETQSWYEQRLATWGRACILCSFRSRRQASFPHPDCMQREYSQSLTDFRRSIRFDNGVGCFRCGQPMAICERKGQGNCRYPWFVWHCCWVAVHEDRLHALELLQALGGPDMSLHAVPETHPHLLGWLGRGCRVFGSVRSSNALRLASVWIDRLDRRCI